MELIAVYGTLKKGFGLHNSFMRNAEFLGPMQINAVMHLRGSYPIISHPEEYSDLHQVATDHEVEVYQLPEDAFNRIKRMEESVGYKTETIDTPYGKASMFWMPRESVSHSDSWISSFSKEEFAEANI